MQEKKKYDLVLFDSPHQSFSFDQKAKEINLSGRLIPVPRALSQSCGMCYRSLVEDRSKLAEFIKNEEMQVKKIVEDYEL